MDEKVIEARILRELLSQGFIAGDKLSEFADWLLQREIHRDYDPQLKIAEELAMLRKRSRY